MIKVVDVSFHHALLQMLVNLTHIFTTVALTEVLRAYDEMLKNG